MNTIFLGLIFCVLIILTLIMDSMHGTLEEINNKIKPLEEDYGPNHIKI